MTIPKDILDVLACPVCKKNVELRNDALVCVDCNKAYPIKDRIPVMLADEATEATSRAPS